jgi:hypothetical protein
MEELKREEPVYTHWMEPSDVPIYDTVYFPTDNRELFAFVDPLGSVVMTSVGPKVKDFTDTNMYESGILNPPGAMFVREITCGFVKNGEILPIRSTWYNGTQLSFYINQKLYYESHVSQLADPAALFADDVERKYAMERDLFKLCRRWLSCPLLIERRESFGVRIRMNKFMDMENQPEKLVIHLHGIYYRAIQ